MSDYFQNVTIIVTGASAGIGRALAIELTRRGARVLAVARSAERLAELRREAGPQLIPVAADVRSADSIEEFAGWALHEFETIDVMINNAGIGVMESFLDTGLDQWRDAIDTNLVGALLLTHSFLPAMLQVGRGVIANVGSTAASGWPYMTLYAATKAALHSASLSIDAEVRERGVRVLSIEIGPTAGTEFGSRFEREKIAKAVGLWHKLGLPFNRQVAVEESVATISTAIESALRECGSAAGAKSGG